jgi:hypothetical protein
MTALEEKGLQAYLKELFTGQLFEFYRGDSFQASVKPVGASLTLALRARALARSMGAAYDVRISIGIGKVPGQLKTLSLAGGEAFLISGRDFDDLKEGQRLSIRGQQEELNQSLRILAAFCDYLFNRLTARQAAVIAELMSGRTQTETAAALSITQATVSAHAASASWPEIEMLLSEFNSITSNIKETE